MMRHGLAISATGRERDAVCGVPGQAGPRRLAFRAVAIGLSCGALLAMSACGPNKAGLPGYPDGVDNSTPSNGLVPGQTPST